MTEKNGSSNRALTNDLVAIAIVLIAAIITVLLTGDLLQIKSDGFENLNEPKYDDVREKILEECSKIVDQGDINCLVDTIESANAYSLKRQDLIVQKQMSRWAFWMLPLALISMLITIVGIWLVKQTLEASLAAVSEARSGTKAALLAANAGLEANKIGHTANKLNQELQHSAVRAYINVHEISFEEPLGEDGNLSGRVFYRNSGQSPSLNTRHELQVIALLSINNEKIDANLVAEKFGLPPVQERPDGSISSLGTGESSNGFAQSDVKVPNNIKDRLAQGTAVIFLRGWIRYDDVFGKTHRTFFCIHCDSHVIKSGMISVRSPFGNSAD